MSTIPTLALNNGVSIPQLGFGVFQVPPDEVVAPVAAALRSGYRLIDTAAAYNNEEGVGRALAESGVPRPELFVTTKLWNADQGYDSALRAFDVSMDKLGLDYLDLYLIHWPRPKRNQYVDTWKALGALYADGRVRAIGVSNFTEEHLDRLAHETDIVPAVNQVELHPGLPQNDLRAYHDKHGIVTESWAPIGQGGGLLDDPRIQQIAESYGKTPAQLVLRWHIELGCVVIPKSVNPARIAENMDIFDFELADDDRDALTSYDGVGRIGPHPDGADFG
jgi:diketogulonate reductase-like aldo/keto reductase